MNVIVPVPFLLYTSILIHYDSHFSQLTNWFQYYCNFQCFFVFMRSFVTHIFNIYHHVVWFQCITCVARSWEYLYNVIIEECGLYKQ